MSEQKKRKTFADLAKAEPPSGPVLTPLRPPDPPKPTQAPLRPPKPRETPAPVRDFNKRANSLERDALPAGLFPGSSKKLYDALYLRTLGAVVPVTTIRATRRELGKWSGIKNIKTIAAHLAHLTTVGLIVHRWERGSTEGSTYEVRLPEDAGIALGWSKPTLDTLSSPEVTLDQKTGQPLDQISVSGGLSQTLDIQRTSGRPNTSLNTKDHDDDRTAFPELRKAERELTGRSSETGTWAELDRLLAEELRAAAARTTVSSAPAFLAAHLRRRLQKPEAPPARAVRAPTADLPPRPAPAPPTDEDLIEMYVSFLHSGMTLEDVEGRLVDPERWPGLKAAVLARYETERTQVGRTGSQSPESQG